MYYNKQNNLKLLNFKNFFTLGGNFMKKSISILNENKFLIIVFILISWLYFYNIGNIPFLDRTDSRYSEIAREMVVSNDYLNPRIFNSLHLHKPPLAYWFTALGLKIFGFNPLGARFFLAVFALLSLFIIYLITQHLFDKSIALKTLILTAISPGLFLTARIVATDIYLLFFQLCAILFFLKYYNQNNNKHLFLFWLMLAFAFLTKGPPGIIPLFLIIFSFLLYKKENKKFKSLFKLKYIFIFLIISFSWFFYIFITIKDSFNYLIVDQLLARIGVIEKIKMGHPQPFYFYLIAINLMLLPYFPVFFKAIYDLRKNLLKKKLVFPFFWLIIPFIFFSLIPTKLSTYIIIIIPATAMIVAFWMENLIKKSNLYLFIIGYLPFVFLFKTNLVKNYVNLNSTLSLLTILTIFAIVITLAVIFKFSKKLLIIFLLNWVLIFTIVLNIFTEFPEIIGANNKICKIINKNYPKESKIVCYKEFGYQIPFYLNKFPILSNVKYELSIDKMKNKIDDDKLISLWNSKKTVIVLCSNNNFQELKSKLKKMIFIAKQGKLSAFTNHEIKN